LSIVAQFPKLQCNIEDRVSGIVRRGGFCWQLDDVGAIIS